MASFIVPAMATRKLFRSERTAIDWAELADGRLRRLRRGADYTGSGEVLENEAKLAARELGKTAVTLRDQIGKYEHLWVQFLDGRIEEGEPCPRCGATSLERVQGYFAHCPTCGALHSLVAPRPDRMRPDEIAQMLGARLLSTDGREIEEFSAVEEAVIEAVCLFHRPVARAQPVFLFMKGPQRALRVGCPDPIVVRQPQTLHFTLHLAPKLLTPGEHKVWPGVSVLLEEDDTDGLMAGRKSPEGHVVALEFQVLEPGAGDDETARQRQRPPLQWTVALPAGDEDQPGAGTQGPG